VYKEHGAFMHVSGAMCEEHDMKIEQFTPNLWGKNWSIFQRS